MAPDLALEETSRICPFCSNNAIAEDKYGGDYAPEKIIPFALNRKDAERAYKSYIEQAMFLPKDWIWKRKPKAQKDKETSRWLVTFSAAS